MALDETCETLIKEIGHDGSQLMWPHLPEPFCRQSFHIQELILCCLTRNKTVTPIDVYPIAGPSPAPGIKQIIHQLEIAIKEKQISVIQLERILAMVRGLNNNQYTVNYPGIYDNEVLFDKIRHKQIGVLTGESLSGQRHAVAWDGEKIYDPCGQIRESYEFVPETFWMIK